MREKCRVETRRRQVVVRHLAAKLMGCPPTLLNDPDAVSSVLDRVTEVVQMTFLERVSHRFSPQGVSVVYLLAESHIAVHTWPECGMVDIEIVTCNPESDVMAGLQEAMRLFSASECDHRVWVFTHDY
ncbi:MAG: adenosylmethionine decarboxylase [Planctomycetota bacterium]|nr:MAG: adenosylmethionine decarboxylase [Planctomycetota bacterium]